MHIEKLFVDFLIESGYYTRFSTNMLNNTGISYIDRYIANFDKKYSNTDVHDYRLLISDAFDWATSYEGRAYWFNAGLAWKHFYEFNKNKISATNIITTSKNKFKSIW